jgi:hypothetical protein
LRWIRVFKILHEDAANYESSDQALIHETWEELKDMILDQNTDQVSEETFQRVPLMEYIRKSIHETYFPYQDFAMHVVKIARSDDHYNEKLKHFQFRMRLSSLKTSELIQGKLLDRRDIADRIQFNDYDGQNRPMTPILNEKITFLKAYITNEQGTCTNDWIQNFLLGVTGSSTVSATTKIKVQGIATPSYCASHTCSNVLDVCDTTHDCPCDPHGELGIADRFIRNLTLGIVTHAHDFGFA